MNEQAIIDSFELFQKEGYNGTLDDFKTLMSTNDEALNDVFGLFANEGYADTKEDYTTLIGVKKKDESIVPSEEVVTELPTTQEVEVSTESDASFTEPQRIFNEYVDEIDANFTGQEEEFAVPEMRYKLEDYGFKFDETGMFGDKMKVTAPNGKKITIDLDETVEGGFFTKSDKETAETLKDFLKKNQDVEQQFNKEEEEYIKEKARIKDEKDVEEGVAELNLRAEEYNDDVKTYVAKSAELKEMEEVYGNLTSEQMLGEYNEGYTKYLDLKENLEGEAKRLSRENDGLELQGMRLDRNVGKWSEMKREQGTWYGTLGKSFYEGVGGVLAGQRNLATDIKSWFISFGKERGMEGAYSNVFVNEAKKRSVEIPEGLDINNEKQFDSFLETVDEDIVSSIDRKILDAIRKKEKYGTVDFVATPEENEIEIVYKGLPEGAKFSGQVARLPLESGTLKATREGLSKMIGGELSSHQYDELAQSQFWMGSLKGVTESLPALVGGKVNRVANLMAQVTDHIYEEMANDPDFVDVPEWEKAAVAAPIGIVVAALEDFGFRNVMKQKGVVSGILMKAMGKVPKGASVKTLTKVIREEVKSSGGRFALSAGIAASAEAETGLLQEITDIGGKAIYNAIKEKDMFRTPDSVGEYVAQVLKAAAQEAVGGFVLGVPNSIKAAYSKADFTQVSDLEFETFTQLTSDNKSYQEYKTALATKLKQQLNAKEITQQEADDTMDAFERVVGVQQGIPTDMSVENQKKALGLSLRLQELKSRAEGTNDAFNKNTNKEIAEIQEQIDNLVGAEVATQEELGIEEMVDETIAPEVTEEAEATEEVEAEVTEEVTPELQTIEEEISEMDGTVEDNLNEVSSVKSETKEAIDGVKKKIADVRKDGSLSREEKSEAIEDLKAEIQDLKDDASSQTETLKEERAEVKREQNKLKRKAKKLREAQPVVAEVTEEVSSKTQEEVTTEEKQDIDSFFGEDVAESTEKVTPKISINRKISDTEKSTKGFTRTQRVVINTAKSVAKAIARVLPETNIIIHETEQEYAKYANPNSRAEFNPTENTIHINLSKAKRTTAAHEAFHALLLNAVKNNDAKAKELSDKFMVAIRKVASGKLLAELDAHAAKYKDTSLQTEEQVAELIGILSANYGQMSKPSKNKVISFLRALGKTLGIPRMEELTKSEEDVIDLLNTLSSRLAAGIELQAEDVSLLESEEQGDSGEVGTISIPKRNDIIETIDSPKVKNDPRSWIKKLVSDFDVFTFEGKKFITNMYDYTNAGVTDLGNGYSINLLGGRNYVAYIMEKTGKKLGDISNLAAFNTKAQAESFIRNSIEGSADIFAPHSGTLDGSWQFQQHIFEELVNLVLDEKILTNKELIDSFNEALSSNKGKEALATFNKKNDSRFKTLNSFKSNPKELVKLLDIENNFSPDLRKALNQKIASNKKFQKAIGVKNLKEFHQRIMDPLNDGVVGGEIMTFIEFDPSTFSVEKTNPNDVDHHPSFGWTVKAKIKKILQPNIFYKSYDLTKEYTKYNKEGAEVSRKTDVGKEKFVQSNVASSAGAIPKTATLSTDELSKVRQQLIAQKLPDTPTQTRDKNGLITSGKVHLYHSTNGVENLNDILENGINFEKQKAVDGLFFSKLGSPYRQDDSFIVIETDIENIPFNQRQDGQEVALGQLSDYKIVHSSRISPRELKALSSLEMILNRETNGGIDGYNKALENYKRKNKNSELVKYLEGVSTEDVIPAGIKFDKLTTEEKSKARKQLIGENALMQQGVRVNYTLAKEMTRQGKSPLVIKRATGWELGGDKMWKYETEDTKLVDSFWKKTPFTFDKTLDNAIKGASYSLKDIVKTDIVKQYPKIGEAKLYVTNTFKVGFNELMTKGSLGFYDADNNQIVINSDIFKGDKTKAIQKFESVLNHELQHAIQFIEGFTVGSNRDISMQQALNLIDALTIEYKQQDGTEEMFNDISELTSLVKALEKLDNKDSQAYLRIGGEVEARNVQKRMEMTDKQKRESLLESTEDVRPEDIIYVFDDYQRTRFTPKKAKTRQQLDTYPMETEGQWYGEGDFKARGGVLTMMSPQDFLSKAKKLEMDEETRENVDDLKKHIQDGKKLDPLTLYSLDATDVRNSDGRHRAIASQELGIQEVPVVDYTQVKTRNQLETVEYINEARDNNFTDATIKDFLVRRKGMSATEVDELLAIKVDKLTTLPKSFGNVKGGAKVGLRLFERVKQFQKKETARNKKRKNPISQAQIMDKTIEFLEAQPEYKKESEAYVEKGVTKYRRGLSVQQAQMQSDLQKSTGQRPTQNMGQKLRAARLLVRQSLRAKKNLQSLKRELRNFMRKALPKDLYTKSETMKLINKITIADENNIENLMDEIIEFAASKNVAALKNQINSFLNGKYTDLQGNRVKGYKIDVATKEAIDRIKKFILPETATSEEILTANEKLLTQYNKLDADPEQTSEIVEQMTELMIAMNINNSYLMEDTNIDKVAALDAVSQFISDLVTEGKTRLKEEMAAQSEEYKRQFAELYEDVTGDKVDLKDSSWIEKLKSKQRVRGLETKRNNVEGRVKNLQRKMANAVTSILINTAESLDGLMDMISKMPGEMFGGKSQELVTERIDASSRVFKARRMLIETMLRETMQKYYGKNWKKKAREFRKTKVTGIYINKNEVQEAQDEYNKNRTTENKQKLEKAIRENELILSQNQMYYYYNQYKDSANHPAFQNMYGVNYARVMEDMTNALEPEVKEFADWQVEVLFPALYNHYNATYRNIYRTNMPQHENYAGKIYREGVITEPMDLISGVGAPFNNTVGAASTKVREETNAKIAETDGSDALFTYLYDMEYFAAYAEAVRDINKLFTNEYIKKAIEDVHGKYTMSLITTAIQKLANKGTRTGLTAKWINGMNNVFITSRLGLNPVVMIKQLTSFVTYANDIGFANWAKYAFTNMSELKKLYKEVRDNSVYMQDRKFDGIMRAIESYADSTELKSFLPSQTKDFMNNFLLFTTKFGDRAAIYLGGLPNYSYYKAEFKKKNPNASEQEAIDYAVIKFERDTKRTQQSGDLQDKDLFQTSDPITRGLNMFLTTPKQYLRKEIQSSRSLWRKLKAWDKSAGKGTVTENIRTMFTYHVMMPVFFQWVAMGLPGALRDWRDDDEEDLLRAAIVGNLNAFFILGEMVNMAGDFFTGKPWAGNVKSAGVLNQASILTQSAVRASKIKDPEKAAVAWRKFQLELVSLTGLPASNVGKMSANIQKLVEGGLDPGEAILRILNFSEYQIEGKKKKKPSKKQIKLTKKEMKKYFPELYDEMEELRDLEYEEEMKELKAQQREERERMLEEMYNDY